MVSYQNHRANLVREMGLEPTRRNHTHLKRACLPFQHSRRCYQRIITCYCTFVNTFLPNGWLFLRTKYAILLVDISEGSKSYDKIFCNTGADAG